MNGCSYTAKHWATLVWSDFIEKRFDVNCVNNAKAGSSNQRIARRTLEDLLTLNMDPQSTMVIIGWTYISRDEVWYQGPKLKSFSPLVENGISPFADGDIWHDQFITTDFMRDEPEWNQMSHMAVDHERQIVHFFPIGFHVD